MMSSQHGSYEWGFTHATMGATKGSDTARWSKSQKYVLSSDCSLQLDCMKAESLVNAGQLYCVEYVPGSCTHRPSSHLIVFTRSPWPNPQGKERPKVRGVRGTKS